MTWIGVELVCPEYFCVIDCTLKTLRVEDKPEPEEPHTSGQRVSWLCYWNSMFSHAQLAAHRNLNLDTCRKATNSSILCIMTPQILKFLSIFVFWELENQKQIQQIVIWVCTVSSAKVYHDHLSCYCLGGICFQDWDKKERKSADGLGFFSGLKQVLEPENTSKRGEKYVQNFGLRLMRARW